MKPQKPWQFRVFKVLKWSFLVLIYKEFKFFTDTDVYIQIFNLGA